MITSRQTSKALLLLTTVVTVIVLLAMHRVSGGMVAHGYDRLPLPLQHALLGGRMGHYLESVGARR